MTQIAWSVSLLPDILTLYASLVPSFQRLAEALSHEESKAEMGCHEESEAEAGCREEPEAEVLMRVRSLCVPYGVRNFSIDLVKGQFVLIRGVGVQGEEGLY